MSNVAGTHDPDVADAQSWLRFASVANLGPASQRKLLSAFGSPQEVFAASRADLLRVVSSTAVSALQAGPDDHVVQTALAWLSEAGNYLLTIADSRYPRALLEIADPPLLLFAKGRLELLRQPALAVVGSRSASAGGARDAQSFAEVLSNAGLTIVSGLALGIDAAAHRGGLAGASSSIGVVGTGLDKVYPARNRQLAHQLAEQGVLLSEFPLGTPPLPGNFPRRNRVISGLSRGVLVIEAALRSGSLITARQALDQGREVYAIPGSIHSPVAKGCHWLIKQGAKLVETAQDVLEELSMAAPRVEAAHEAVQLDPAAATLLSSLGFEPIDLDTICERAGIAAEVASNLLLSLELAGYVARLPGGLLQRMQ
ncbi:MAG: DNA-processing protein DprA [Betaproteobacteria bacterium]